MTIFEPDKARELLEQVKETCPIPWEAFTTDTLEGEEACNVRYASKKFGDVLSYCVSYGGTTEIDPDAIDLIVAAPDLAATVAGMRYEYAVQAYSEWDGWTTVYVRYTYKQAVTMQDLWRGYETRIARRLAGEWEEVPEATS